MASAEQPSQFLSFEELLEATDEGLTRLILERPWDCRATNDQLHPEPPPKYSELPELQLLCERLRKQREKALAPPFPVTEERHELAARSLLIHSSVGILIARSRPRLLDPDIPPEKKALEFLGDHGANNFESEKVAYRLLVELGGRPVYSCSIDRFIELRLWMSYDNTIAPAMVRPWSHLRHLVGFCHRNLAVRFHGGHPELRVWQTFLTQVKNWERFRTWQRDHRGPNNEDTYEAFIQEKYRDSEIVQRRVNDRLWRQRLESNQESLMEEWETRERNRAIHREHGCDGFADYCLAVQHRLKSYYNFSHPFQLHQDPKQQDPLTTWIEYISYECWWQGHYATAFDSAQQALKSEVAKVISSKVFGEEEVWIDENQRIKSQTERVWQPVDLLHLGENRKDIPSVYDACQALRAIGLDLQEVGRDIRQGKSWKQVVETGRTSPQSEQDRVLANFELASERAEVRKYLIDLDDECRFRLEIIHWQQRLVDWALSELPLVEDEVRNLPGSSDIPMIAARAGRKRVRFTEAEPTIRVFQRDDMATVDEQQHFDPSDETEEPQAKRLRLRVDEYPGRARSLSENSMSRSGSLQHDIPPVTSNSVGDARQTQREEEDEHSINSQPPISSPEPCQSRESQPRNNSSYWAEQDPLDDGPIPAEQDPLNDCPTPAEQDPLDDGPIPAEQDSLGDGPIPTDQHSLDGRPIPTGRDPLGDNPISTEQDSLDDRPIPAEQDPPSTGHNVPPAASESVGDGNGDGREAKDKRSTAKKSRRAVRSRQPESPHLRRRSTRGLPGYKTLGSIWCRRSPRNTSRNERGA